MSSRMTDVTLTPADWFPRLFSDPETTQRWLAGLGVRDTGRAARDFRDLARIAGREALLATMAAQFHVFLPRCPDPGMALTNLERFVAAGEHPRTVLEDLAAHPRTTEVLVQ